MPGMEVVPARELAVRADSVVRPDKWANVEPGVSASKVKAAFGAPNAERDLSRSSEEDSKIRVFHVRPKKPTTDAAMEFGTKSVIYHDDKGIVTVEG